MAFSKAPFSFGKTKKGAPEEVLRNEVSISSEKEYIQNGGNPCKIRISAVFLCSFVA